MFEQFCINYANEKLQQFCVQRLIIDEQKWYVKQGLKIPTIKYLSNDEVVGKYLYLISKLAFENFINLQINHLFDLDLIEHKHNGLVTLLEDECKTLKSSSENYFEKIKAVNVG